MTDAPKPPTEREIALRWLQTHTALGRIGLGELEAAFDRAELEGGYVLTKTTPGASNA